MNLKKHQNTNKKLPKYFFQFKIFLFILLIHKK
jgi:hypothetical protein